MAPPATVTVIGDVGSGKSTLVNCLVELKDVGDGTLNVLDTPGCDADYNPIVKDMLKLAASHSDVVMVNVPPNTINTEILGKVLDIVEQGASHVMKPRMHKRVEVPNDVRLVFIISKCDAVVEDVLQDLQADDDSRNNQSQEQVVAELIPKLKAKLRDVLDRRWGQSFPHAARAPIFAISAQNLLHNRRREGSKAEFDWPQVEEFLRSIHAQSANLQVDRKLQQASRVINLMHETINNCEGYPIRAKQAIALAEEDSKAQKLAQWMRKVVCAMGGGWWAVGDQAYTSATAAAVAASGQVMSGEKYMDTLVSGESVSGQKVIYVGEFVGRKPHGHGRAFWSNSVGSESIIGEFEHGRFRKGMVLDEGAVVIGNFLQDEIKGLVLDGVQPDDF